MVQQGQIHGHVLGDETHTNDVPVFYDPTWTNTDYRSWPKIPWIRRSSYHPRIPLSLPLLADVPRHCDIRTAGHKDCLESLLPDLEFDKRIRKKKQVCSNKDVFEERDKDIIVERYARFDCMLLLADRLQVVCKVICGLFAVRDLYLNFC